MLITTLKGYTKSEKKSLKITSISQMVAINGISGHNTTYSMINFFTLKHID